MFSRLFTSILVLIPLLSHYQVFSSPVLLWSNTNFPQTPVSLSSLSPLQFLSNSICQLTNEQIQLRLFAVNDLTHQEIERGSQSQHALLRAAQSERAFRYFPNVKGDVYKTLSSIERSNNYDCSHIQFQISSSNVYSSLHEALNAMEASISGLGSESNTAVVMALIEGPDRHQSEIRVLRSIESTDDVLMSDDFSCMFYADRLHLGSINTSNTSMTSYKLDLEKSSCLVNGSNMTNSTDSVVLELHWFTSDNDTEAITTTLHVAMTGLYWTLEKFVFNESEYRYFAYGMHSLMDTPPAFSYVCTTATFVKYGSVNKTYDFSNRLFITNLQFQPFNGNGTFFGPPNYCTSFFTSGIWMGITSSLLCLGILLFGISRLMAIKSNDRFDDPKGKPLVIKALE